MLGLPWGFPLVPDYPPKIQGTRTQPPHCRSANQGPCSKPPEAEAPLPPPSLSFLAIAVLVRIVLLLPWGLPGPWSSRRGLLPSCCPSLACQVSARASTVGQARPLLLRGSVAAPCTCCALQVTEPTGDALAWDLLPCQPLLLRFVSVAAVLTFFLEADAAPRLAVVPTLGCCRDGLVLACLDPGFELC